MSTKNPLYLVADTLRRGGVGVLPTDTIYGIVGSALREKTVKKIYRLRKRNPKKPMIILVDSVGVLRKFGVVPNASVKKILKNLWPGKVSVILPISGSGAIRKFAYLHRGSKGLAFRMPKPLRLRQLLGKTGPLVAPSANTEGKPPARTIKEAKKYFGDRIDFYVDSGRLVAKPSKLISIEKGKVTVLRH